MAVLVHLHQTQQDVAYVGYSIFHLHWYHVIGTYVTLIDENLYDFIG